MKKQYDVIEAENSSEAYSKFISKAPNIVFLDINLPDGTGIEIIDKINEVDDNGFIVMLSGNSFKDNIVKSIQKGAKGFITKPFPKEKIFSYIDRYYKENKD